MQQNRAGQQLLTSKNLQEPKTSKSVRSHCISSVFAQDPLLYAIRNDGKYRFPSLITVAGVGRAVTHMRPPLARAVYDQLVGVGLRDRAAGRPAARQCARLVANAPFLAGVHNGSGKSDAKKKKSAAQAFLETKSNIPTAQMFLRHAALLVVVVVG